MSILLTILIFVVVVYFTTLVVIIIGFEKQKRRKSKTVNNAQLNKISVVIAARNEDKNIEKCIHAVFNQSLSTDFYEVIVIDDHSVDNTLKIIEKLSQTYHCLECFSLKELYGKKAAIKFGVSKSNYEIIAITDADCEVPYTWLESISNQFCKNTSLLLGPIQFNSSNKFLSVFQELDMFALQGFTFGSVHYNNPILINAANMAFCKTDFLKNYPTATQNIPSGDDMFLLEEFKKGKKNISGLLHLDFVVKTTSLTDLMEFIYQRVRWASKNKYFKDRWIQYFGILMLITNLSMILIYLQLIFVEQNRGVCIILLLTKWLIDFILLFLVSSFFKRGKLLAYFIPVQLVYPLYIMVVGILSIFFKIKWKGRVYNG